MRDPMFIAEAGVNHDGDLDAALALVDAAAAAGADIIKFQTFKADRVAAPSAAQAAYQSANTGKVELQLDMLRRLELSESMHTAIAQRCREKGIEFLSTAFDPDLLRYLVETIGIARIKIPSGEVTNPLLLDYAASTGLPILLSTGMCTLDDIEDALGMLAFFGIQGRRGTREDFRAAAKDANGSLWLAEHVTVLHCTSEYPTPLQQANISAITTLQARFGLPVGYSDHTLGSIAPLGAVALGATVIEKHVTLDQGRAGPDHKASLPVAELELLITDLRAMRATLGSGEKLPTALERHTMALVRRGVFAAHDLPAGCQLDQNDIVLLRPATALDARDFWSIVGKPLKASVRRGEPISLED